MKTDNELIAEFMGHRHGQLIYKHSWDWLIPVVEKIESIWDDFHGYFGVHISSNSCVIQGTNLRTDTENFHPAYFSQHHAGTKLNATYEAVIEFIKWYNESRTTRS